jgi:hypothetical protein
MYTSTEISSAAAGYSSGSQLLKSFKKAENYQEDMILTGISADEVSQGNQAIWVLSFCLYLFTAHNKVLFCPSVILSRVYLPFC